MDEANPQRERTAPPRAIRGVIAVVLDTTNLRSGDRVRLEGLATLARAARTTGLAIRIPVVAGAEAARAGVAEVEAAERAVQEAVTSLGKFGLPVPTYAPAEKETIRRHVDAAIRGAAAGADFAVLPMPNVSHEDVLRRDLRRQKPFDGTGKGYRDTLIWESLLTFGEENGPERIYFISANKKDFAGDDGALHPTLVAEAVELGLTVTLVPTIPDFLDRVLKPQLAPDAEVSGRPFADVLPTAAAEMVSRVDAIFEGAAYLYELNEEASDGEIIVRGRVKTGTVNWARRLLSGETLLDVSAVIYLIVRYDDSEDPRDPAEHYAAGDAQLSLRAVVDRAGNLVAMDLLEPSPDDDLGDMDRVDWVNLENHYAWQDRDVGEE